MSAALQGPGLSPDLLWGELMGLTLHRLLGMHHRVTLPWRVGTDSGVKSWRPMGTCQISPVKTQRCGLWRRILLCLGHEDSVWILSLSWFFSFKGGKWSREKYEKNWGKAQQRLIIETGQESQITSAGYCLLSAVTSPQQSLPWFTPSSSLAGAALIWASYWLAPADGGFRAWLCPQTLTELPGQSRVQRYPVAIAWGCQAYIS